MPPYDSVQSEDGVGLENELAICASGRLVLPLSISTK